ncbi:helix-turn-helix transcriptional regulator [Anoxybacterium hadale]|uniref:Helix-turn-helix transcriptional regulator n=1 Tax=Anoxybacterium hadale TaxID=3408580 RepID=A0ACD1AFM9_9FIRM|nr:helix-turn-helix transcriptional regulator [Clostridiales bacterium]
MAHIVFLIHILAFIFGCVCIIFSALLYRKYKNGIARYYTLFLTSLLMILLERTFTYYKLASILEGQYSDVVFWVISCMGCGLLIFSLPLLLGELLGLAISKRKRLIFGLLAFLPTIALVLYYTLPYKILILNIIDAILFLLLLYCFCLAVVLRSSFKSLDMKRMISPFMILLAVWLPAVFLDFRLQQVPGIQNLFPYGFLSIPIFYTAWNILTVYYGRNYLDLVMLSSRREGDGLLENLLGEKLGMKAKAEDEDEAGVLEERESKGERDHGFGLTDREQDVAALLIKGYSYQKISEELFISLSTARTHGYNIYKKVGVSNKVELTNRLKYQPPHTDEVAKNTLKIE